jgi:hypothetical protein
MNSHRLLKRIVENRFIKIQIKYMPHISSYPTLQAFDAFGPLRLKYDISKESVFTLVPSLEVLPMLVSDCNFNLRFKINRRFDRRLSSGDVRATNRPLMLYCEKQKFA